MSTKKTPRHTRSRSTDTFAALVSAASSENSDPNLPIPTTPPSTRPTKTPSSAAKPKKNLLPPPPPLPKERKFIVVAKKAALSRKGGDDSKRRQELAYEALRASHEDFFKKDLSGDREAEAKSPVVAAESHPAAEEAPEPGSGRVKNLVEAFETLLSVSATAAADKSSSRSKPGVLADRDWALPGMRQPVMEAEAGEGLASFVFPPPARFVPTKDFERDSRLYSSLDGDGERLSWGSRSRRSSGSQGSRRNSSDCLRRSWDKKLKVTSQQPFKLRTEQRGKLKEENFLQKVKEMLVEEEKKRIPIAQGLPWTTDEPECLVKPPVKESTEPIDLVLHSDVRAVERAEFDHYVADRLSLAEQMRLERERQQKLEEEEEIRRLRRELVPKAQPMPYFDRPFIPKRSARPRTVPKEPRFHVRAMRSSSSSCVSLVGR